MATIVRYTDAYRPVNWYPSRIISPSRPSACCFSEMDEIGEPEQEGRWAFRYKRCPRCGFTVRLVLEETPDGQLLADLRRVLARTFSRPERQGRGAHDGRGPGRVPLPAATV